MTFLTKWLLSIIGTAFLIAIAEALMPDQRVREVGRLVGGLLLLLALLNPLLQLRLGEWDLSVGDYFSQVEEKENTYRQQQTDSFEILIKEECEAYIVTAAEELGLTVSAQIETAFDDNGTVQITSVRLNIPYHTALSARIEEDLGLGPAQQNWATKETG